MTFAFIVLACLFVFVLVIKLLEDRVGTVIRRLRHSETRITGLEVKDYAQDLRLDAQQTVIKELGKDIGWDDAFSKTDEIKPKDPDDAA